MVINKHTIIILQLSIFIVLLKQLNKTNANSIDMTKILYWPVWRSNTKIDRLLYHGKSEFVRCRRNEKSRTVEQQEWLVRTWNYSRVYMEGYIITKVLTKVWAIYSVPLLLNSLGLKCRTFIVLNMKRDCLIYLYVHLVRINIRQYGRRFAYTSRNFHYSKQNCVL